jgi:hypothetical protein
MDDFVSLIKFEKQIKLIAILGNGEWTDRKKKKHV